jgi:hypothetical protein
MPIMNLLRKKSGKQSHSPQPQRNKISRNKPPKEVKDLYNEKFIKH